LLPGERDVSIRLGPSVGRCAGCQDPRTQPDPNLEVVRSGHDELFLERLRDELELLRVPFEPDRLPDPDRLRLELDEDPLDRVEPRFEPRLVLRVVLFFDPEDPPPWAPVACPPVASPACCST
jgi:hypothetical protein